MRVLEQLQSEHRALEQMLTRAQEGARARSGAAVLAALDFFLEVGDGVHHAKEERVLFVPLAKVAPGPVSLMLREHEAARERLARLRQATARGEWAHVEAMLELYGTDMRHHHHKEDNIIYPLAERLLGPETDAHLMVQVEAIQDRRMSRETYARWMDAAHGVAPEPTQVVRTAYPVNTLEGLVSLLDAPRVEVAPTPVLRDTDESTAPPVAARAPAPSAEVVVTSPGLAFVDARTLTHDEPPAVAPDTAGSRVLYARGTHRNVLLDGQGRGLALQANQYLIVHRGEGMVLDPGGPKVYPQVYAEAMKHLAPQGLRYIFLSHQDPDIGTSINAWLMDTEADALISRLWVRFLPHFGIDRLLEHRLHGIPDEGMRVDLAGAELVILPAHFLHSPGNFQVYDPASRTLFSGDLGASLGTEDEDVKDFAAHVPSMLPFHQRYMASRVAMRAWADMVRELDIEVIAPQHGALLRGRDLVGQFIEWCAQTPCGVDLIRTYRVPPRR